MSKSDLIRTKNANTNLRLKLFTIIKYIDEPITRPNPFAVPNIPNSLSFM